MADERIIQYLTSIFTPLSIACTYHAFSHIEVSMLQPHVAQVTIQYGNLDFIHSWLIFRCCGITTSQNIFIQISLSYTGWTNTHVRARSTHQNTETISYEYGYRKASFSVFFPSKIFYAISHICCFHFMCRWVVWLLQYQQNQHKECHWSFSLCCINSTSLPSKFDFLY